jgi:hypothetical protein
MELENSQERIEDAGSGFPDLLRGLRCGYFEKQLVLARAVGCTEAAVSLWENGKRLPTRLTIMRVLRAFGGSGASSAELHRLHVCWREAMTGRLID